MTKRERKYHWVKRLQRRVKQRLSENIPKRPSPHYTYDLSDYTLVTNRNVLTCSESTFESLKGQVAPITGFNLCGMGISVIQSSIFPFERKWAACDIETKLEHQIPSGEWVHGVMVTPPAREQSIGLMVPPQPKEWHPYLDKVREEMYGYQYPFMTF